MPFVHKIFFTTQNSLAYLPIAFLLILFGTLYSFDSFCQSQDLGYSVVQYNTENGLPQNSVNAIQFDKAGYCWLATEMGLVRFDGKTFKEFGDILPSKMTPFRVENLAPDSTGSLHARLPDSDKKLEMIIETAEKQKASFPVLVDHAHTYVPVVGYAINGNAIFKMDSLFYFRNNSPVLSTALINRMGQVYLAHQEQLYFIKNRNITLLSDHQNRFKNGNESTLVDNCFIHLKPGNSVATWKNGRFQPSISSIQGVISYDLDYLLGNIKAFWCVEGTFLYSGRSLYRIYFKHDILTSERVLGNLDVINMSSVYYSGKHGKYFIGSKTEGLLVITPYIFQYPNTPKKASSQIFYPQSKTAKDEIFSNDILFSKNAKPKHISLNSKDGMSSYIAPDNQLYYESDFVLRRYDLTTRQNYQLCKLDSRLRSIIPDKDIILFFTRKSVGTIDKDSARLISRFPNDIKIVSSFRLSKEHFLLSTESGLKWYNLRQNKIYRSVLDSLQIRASMPDSAGRIWIASYGMGFYLYENEKIVRLPYGPKQALTTVHAFIDDGKGYFWLPTNNGLFKVRKKDLLDFAHQKMDNVYYYMFDKENGLRTNEFNGGCDPPYVRLKDGMLSLSSINGLVWFYPHKIKILYPQNDIYIDNVVINGKQARFGNNPILLDPDFEDLSVTVSSPYFGNSANMDIQYRIVGLNSWQPLPANGKIVVGRSPAGSYKIVVRNTFSLKTNKPKILEVSFEVKPWFYNTWWFYTVLAALLIGTAYLVVRTRIKNLKERSMQLEHIIDMRTQELKASVEELTHSQAALLKSTRVKDSVISMVLHDLRSPISFLNAISSYLAKSHTSMDSHSLTQKLTELESGTVALNDFTQKFFDWAKSQHEDFKVQKTTFPIQELLDEITGLYKEILKSSNNQLLATPTNLMCYTDYQILALVIRNLIDNASKNTSNGRITLFVQPSGNDIAISVSDTGAGLTDDQIKVFLDKNKGWSHEGIGSTLVLSMLDKINSRLDISSSVENGSTFSVILRHQSQFDTD